MSFSSISFLIFMVAVFILYWILPQSCRWAALLAANVVFYASFEARFLILILLLTVGSYFCAILLETYRNRAKLILGLSVALLVCCLAVLKYSDFALSSIDSITRTFAIPFTKPALKLIQPVGISFFTFMMIGYLVDVYREKVPACRHFGHYAVFVSFFANITAGPIERADHFLPQLREKKTFDYEQAAYGAMLLLIGLTKKIVIADCVSKYVDAAYENLHACTAASIGLATLLFALQIYCDFSGYSDMAVGVAKLLGFDLIINFKQPYFARSIREFWATWHISLSTWLRDYIYIPLGGNRKGTVRRNLNLIATFLISGLWHGANWTYVLWGLIHGTAQVIENAVYRRTPEGKAPSFGKPSTAKLPIRILQHALTLLVIYVSWIFFRANTIGDAFYALTHLVTKGEILNSVFDLVMSRKSLLKVGFMALGLFLYDFFSRRQDVIWWLRARKWPLRWACYVIFAVLVIVLKIHNGAEEAFIYLQF